MKFIISGEDCEHEISNEDVIFYLHVDGLNKVLNRVKNVRNTSFIKGSFSAVDGDYSINYIVNNKDINELTAMINIAMLQYECCFVDNIQFYIKEKPIDIEHAIYCLGALNFKKVKSLIYRGIREGNINNIYFKVIDINKAIKELNKMFNSLIVDFKK